MDIADRCGFTGKAKRQIQVKYSITLSIRILTFSISPSFNGQAGFDCPLTQAQVEVGTCLHPCATYSRRFLAFPWWFIGRNWLVDCIRVLYIHITDFYNGLYVFSLIICPLDLVKPRALVPSQGHS